MQELLEEMHGVVRFSDAFWSYWRAGWLLAVASGCLLGTVACGSGDEATQHPGSGVAKSHKQRKTEAATGSGEQPVGDMVSAVSAAKGPPVELKFSLPVRPEVGQLTEINVAVVPGVPVPDSVSVSFQVAEGLEIIEGSQLERVEKLTVGTAVRHVVKVLPKRDGIFALTAVVSYSASSQEMTRTYSIPVIAGEGMPNQVAKGP